MVDGAERQPVGPAAAEVGDVDVLHEEQNSLKARKRHSGFHHYHRLSLNRKSHEDRPVHTHNAH